MVVNCGEIVICVLCVVFEFNLWIVVIYMYEDCYLLYRYKADEVYQVGEDNDLFKFYFDIEEIIWVAKFYEVDVIYFGYGFFFENVIFVCCCWEEGIEFVGLFLESME